MKKLLKKLKFRKIKMWQLFFSLLVISNLVYLLNNYFGSSITLIFFLFVPGYLLLKTITNEMKSHWEIASFSLGLSLLLLMLGGLALNTLNIVGLKQPLTTPNIFIMLDVMTLILLFFNRNKTLKLPTFKFWLPIKATIMVLLLTLLPFLAAGGAISLNNGGPNTFTMILFGLIPVLFIILIWRKELKLLYPYAVLMMGMAILFTTSLRGWYITGHDIRHEFSVFQNTYNDNLWPVRLATGDPYNACLSITILPTIIAKITAIPAMYVYKLIFQIIFAFGLLPIYLFIKKLSNEKYAFIGAFIFISFPTFLNDMSFLNRQEIAFIFFGLLILTTFSNIKKKLKIILSIFLLISIMLSHYSSNYVTLVLLTSSWIIYNFLRRIQVIKTQFEISILRFPIIFGAFLLTFLWNSQITVSASNLESSITQAINDFRYNKSIKDSFLNYSLIGHTAINLRKEFEDFVIGRKSSARYVAPYDLPVTNFGQTVSSIIDIKTFNYGMHTFVAKLYQVLMILGIVVYFFKMKKMPQKKEAYYFTIITSSLALLVIFTVIPRLANGYTITRLIQQTLVLTALPIIIAGEFIFFFIHRFKLLAISILFIMLFLHSSGFIPQLTGGYRPQLSLNNSGMYYDFFYTHRSDIIGTEWLANNRDKNLTIFVDTPAASPLLKYRVYTGLIYNQKSTTSHSEPGYLYEDYINVTKGIYRAWLYSGNIVEYFNPIPRANRNLLYNNKFSHIYDKR